jgi:protein-disulfide isomerase
MLKTILSLSLFTLVSTSVTAAEFFEPEQEFKTKVERVIGKHSKRIAYFKSYDDLVGVAVIGPSYRKHEFYTNQNADYMYSGVLIDTETLDKVNGKSVADLTLLQDDPELLKMIDNIKSVSPVSQGQGGNEIYAVIDPNCSYCHRLWNEIQTIYAKNPKVDLKVNWVLVATIGGEDSKRKGQAITSASKEQAFEILEAGMYKAPPFNKNSPPEQMLAIQKKIAEVREKLTVSDEKKWLGKENLAKHSLFMDTFKFGGVPLVISKVNGIWDVNPGMPGPEFFAKLQDHKSSSNDVSTIAQAD